MESVLVTILQGKLALHHFDPGPQDGALGPKTYAALFNYMAGRDLGDRGKALGAGATAHFPSFGINTSLRIAHFLAQFSVETQAFSRFEENLNYSAQRLCAVWPRRFPNVSAAQPFAGNPEKLADFVYGGRMGNTGPDDGWKYRGRGGGLTGKDNYREAGELTGLDLLTTPDQAADPSVAVLILCGYWTKRHINAMADADDISAVTLAVNGGLNGLGDRKAAYAKARAVL
jgi:putative chitinase